MVNHTRREFLKSGLRAALGGAAVLSGIEAIAELGHDKARDSMNTGTSIRINTLEKLGEIIREGKPAEILYDLGEGTEKTGLLLGYINEDESNSYSARVEDSLRIKLYNNNGQISIDITDSKGRNLKDIDDSDGRLIDIASSSGTVQKPYRNLRPQGAVFEQPTHPLYESGTLVVYLEEGGKVTFDQYNRPE